MVCYYSSGWHGVIDPFLFAHHTMNAAYPDFMYTLNSQIKWPQALLHTYKFSRHVILDGNVLN